MDLINKKYWFYIHPYVYVSYVNDSEMFLYNTQNGLCINSKNIIDINLIKEIHSPVNLGVIEISNAYNICSNFIEEIIEKEIGNIIEIQNGIEKPINLLPILSLQKDIDKLILQDENLMGNNILPYLSELNIVINENCDQSCPKCESYFKQVRCCSKQGFYVNLSLDVIDNILSQVKYSSVKKINILGGNIFEYQHWDGLMKLISDYCFDYCFYIHHKNIDMHKVKSISQKQKIEILITFPLNEEETILTVKENFGYSFIIENEAQYILANNLIDKYALTQSNIIPVFTGKNISFFEENVYLNKEDLFSSVKSMRSIFCNQKLNANDFGSLTVLPNGAVKANINAKELGNIYQDSILELIYKELIENTAWRKIRNQAPCANCVYQFLCPPPSNYEATIGRPNLCHINP